jgi:hypothetical protein
MATGAPRGVSYEQMVTYVDGQIRPIEDHMTAHDNWHRDRLGAEAQANRAHALAVWAVVIAAGTGIGGLVVQILVHR